MQSAAIFWIIIYHLWIRIAMPILVWMVSILLSVTKLYGTNSPRQPGKWCDCIDRKKVSSAFNMLNKGTKSQLNIRRFNGIFSFWIKSSPFAKGFPVLPCCRNRLCRIYMKRSVKNWKDNVKEREVWSKLMSVHVIKHSCFLQTFSVLSHLYRWNIFTHWSVLTTSKPQNFYTHLTIVQRNAWVKHSCTGLRDRMHTCKNNGMCCRI